MSKSIRSVAVYFAVMIFFIMSLTGWFCGQSPIDPTGGPEVPATEGPSRQSNRVELAGAINESLSLTFSVRPGLSPIERPELVVGGFKSAGKWIDSSAVTLALEKLSSPCELPSR